MRCRRAQRWVSTALDGELSPERAEWLQDHLASCARCRAFSADLASVGNALASMSAADPRWGFADRVAARIADIEPEAGWLRFVKLAPLGMGVAAFCAGVALVTLANGDADSAATPRIDAVAVLADSYLGTVTPTGPADELISLLPKSED